MRDSDKALLSSVSKRCKVTILLFGLPYALENVPKRRKCIDDRCRSPRGRNRSGKRNFGKHDINGRLATSTGQWQEGQGEDLKVKVFL